MPSIPPLPEQPRKPPLPEQPRTPPLPEHCLNNRGSLQCLNNRGSLQCLNNRGSLHCLKNRGSLHCLNNRGSLHCLNNRGSFHCLNNRGSNQPICWEEYLENVLFIYIFISRILDAVLDEISNVCTSWLCLILCMPDPLFYWLSNWVILSDPSPEIPTSVIFSYTFLI